MSPRPYRRGAKRDAGTEQTRARITAAALKLLMGEAPGGFSIDAVARTADVARMTVYYQFGSKRGLLASVFDFLGERGGMHGLRDAFGEAEPDASLRRFIAVFVRFYDTNRAFIRRLNALSVLDPELGQELTQRTGWRHEGLRTLLGRFAKAAGKRRGAAFDDALAMLDTVLNFDTFERLASEGRSLQHIERLLLSMARGAIDTLSA